MDFLRRSVEQAWLFAQTSEAFDAASRRFHIGVMIVGFCILVLSGALLFRRPTQKASKGFLVAGGMITSLLAFIGFVILLYGWVGYSQ